MLLLLLLGARVGEVISLLTALFLLPSMNLREEVGFVVCAVVLVEHEPDAGIRATEEVVLGLLLLFGIFIVSSVHRLLELSISEQSGISTEVRLLDLLGKSFLLPSLLSLLCSFPPGSLDSDRRRDGLVLLLLRGSLSSATAIVRTQSDRLFLHFLELRSTFGRVSHVTVVFGIRWSVGRCDKLLETEEFLFVVLLFALSVPSDFLFFPFLLSFFSFFFFFFFFVFFFVFFFGTNIIMMWCC